MTKLSTNYTAEMIVAPGYIKSLTDQQWQMLSNISRILEVIGSIAECKLIVTSGLRTLRDYERLIKAGYNPSPKSDHFYGLKPFTSGAVDIVTTPGGCSVGRLFHILCACYDKKNEWFHLPGGTYLHVGQLIYEVNPIKKIEWIHVSNPKTLFFDSPPKVSVLLKSLDGGITYEAI